MVPPPVWPFSSAAAAVASEWWSGGKRVEIVVRMSGAAAGGEESRRGRKCRRIFRSPRTMMEKKAVRKKIREAGQGIRSRAPKMHQIPFSTRKGGRSPLHQVAVGKKTAADKKGIPLPLLLLFGPMDPRYDLTWRRRRRRRKPDSSVRYRLTGSPPPPFPSSAKPPPPPPGRKEGEIA